MSASDLLKEMMGKSTLQQTPMLPVRGNTREERIALFNQAVDKNAKLKIISKQTTDFNRKQQWTTNNGKSIPLSSLHPIPLEELKVGKTHTGCVIYCKIATRVLQSTSAMVLVEDDSGIKDLAVYGDVNRNKLRVGRWIAIREPFYKIRHDGSEGIRIDDPACDLVFDPPSRPEHVPGKNTSTSQTAQQPPDPPQRLTVEERLQSLVREDESRGVDKLCSQLKEEGYSISKKRVRALKRAIQSNLADNAEGSDNNEGDSTIDPIISERQPDKHRVFRVSAVLEHKNAGNEAFKSRSFAKAEECYSKALECRNDPPDESSEEVALWQLYSNRAAAQMKLGLLHEALQDALKSNICAPVDTVKPLLRCAEVLASLGLTHEATNLLDSAIRKFPDSKETMEDKKTNILPKKCLRVGTDKEFTTISDAVRHAPSGAEILVDAGVYHESLILTKPVTLRCSNVKDYYAIQSLQGDQGKNKWAEIRGNGTFGSVSSILDHSHVGRQIHIIGFKISCDAPIIQSNHSLYVRSGILVCRNCILTSTSGPTVCADTQGTKLVMQACAVRDGAQGGILVAEGAHLSLHQVHCCRNAATGLELRSRGSAFVEDCHFYSNGRQGVMAWQSAGLLTARDCEIHSQQQESGVLICESEASLEACSVYGNGLSGIVTQQKGRVRVVKCEVHNNCEGVLIQDTGSAHIEKCKVYSNRANGIFVGFDHRGKAALIENEARENRSRGIFVAVKTSNVVVRRNVESNNLGLPPSLPTIIDPRQANVSKKYLKRMQKNQDSIKKAGKEDSFFNSILKGSGADYADIHERVMGGLKASHEQCSLCHALPAEGQTFSLCSRCKIVSYCSKECQKNDWPQHKKKCFDKSVKYPTFIDPNISI